MPTVKTSSIITGVLILLIIFMSTYVVREGQQALVLRLGEIVVDSKTEQPYVAKAGLHFKAPLINQVRKFDTRLQTLSVQSSRILTQEQKYVLVDYYIKWRVADLPLYYKRTGGDKTRAETLLQQQVNDALRAAFGQRTISDLVSGERVNIMLLLRDSANLTAKNLGIYVADVRIKSIDLPKEVSDTVYSRMRSKREQVAIQHRADGKAQAEAIRATADAKAAISVSQAKTQAAQLRAQGLSQASNIYANAYNKDPEFYAFYRSLEVYRKAFSDKNDVLVLSPSSELFKYFSGIKGPTAVTKQ